jgi:hypothetical protein
LCGYSRRECAQTEKGFHAGADNRERPLVWAGGLAQEPPNECADADPGRADGDANSLPKISSSWRSSSPSLLLEKPILDIAAQGHAIANSGNNCAWSVGQQAAHIFDAKFFNRSSVVGG